MNWEAVRWVAIAVEFFFIGYAFCHLVNMSAKDRERFRRMDTELQNCLKWLDEAREIAKTPYVPYVHPNDAA